MEIKNIVEKKKKHKELDDIDKDVIMVKKNCYGGESRNIESNEFIFIFFSDFLAEFVTRTKLCFFSYLPMGIFLILAWSF